MRKESLFAGLLALLLMFVFWGCEQANSGTKPNPDDSWTKVETVDGLEGVWKSSVTGTSKDPGSDEPVMTIVSTFTYPTTEGELSMEVVWNEEPDDPILLSKDEAEAALKNGQIYMPVMGEGFGYMEVNGDKTKLRVKKIVKEGDEDWDLIQIQTELVTWEGDIKITSEPTQITVEQYYNKQK